MPHAHAAEKDILFFETTLGAAGPFGSGLPSDFCSGKQLTNKSITALGQAAVAAHNMITGGQCFQTCRNPATFLSADETHITFDLQSNCTGDVYTIPVIAVRAPKQPYCPITAAGNPCDVAAQAKIQTEVDYAATDRFGLSFSRIYNSRVQINTDGSSTTLGPGWLSNFDRTATRVNIVIAASAVGPTYGFAQIIRPTGQLIGFTYNATTSQWVADPDIRERLEQRVDGQGNHAGWILHSGADNSYEVYGTSGKLDALVDNNGYTQALVYRTDNGLLQSVTDGAGRSLAFAYDTSGRLQTLTEPNGALHTYTYDASGYLYHVISPGTAVNPLDNPFREYHYEKAVTTAGGLSTNLLTSLVDENTNTYVSWDYDAAGRPTLSVHGAPTALIDRTVIAYPTADTASVTSALGVTSQFTFVDQLGVRKFGSISAPCASCGVKDQWMLYDPVTGFPQASADFNGTVTNTTYNARGLEVVQVAAASTAASANPPEKRTIQTDWHMTFRVPIERRTYNASNVLESRTDWTYNTRGQPLFRCSIDPAISAAASYTCGSSTNAPTGVRQSAMTYCEQAGVTAGTCPIVGLVLSADGPRTDISDVTTYTYRQSDDPTCASNGACSYRHGDLWKVTNALGQISTTVSYDKNGRVTRMQDANGTYTDMTYHPRGWLLTRTVRANADGSANATLDATTTFAYDNVGNVTRVTQPDATYLAYSYDAAHRLTDITDNLSNRVHYTLDAAGNRIKEDTYDASYDPAHPAVGLKREMARVYDQLNRLVTAKNAQNIAVQTYTNPADAPPSGITYTDGYDGNGNAIYTVDGLGAGTEQQYDPLNRLVKTLQDHTGQSAATHDTTTQYAYDARDNLRSVTDPDNLVTAYTYDGLNNLTTLQSPDTGSTGYTYDAAGNRKTQTDARGVISSYSYDALNRLTAFSYPTSTLNVSYAYDQPASGCANIGRLTTMSDSSGSTTYCYDRRGNVLWKMQLVKPDTNVPALTGWAYNLADRVTAMTYPSGLQLSYVRNSIGQIAQISYKTSATAASVTLISAASYYPFGPLNVLTYGNGGTQTRSYDQDYAIDKIVGSGLNGLVLDSTVDVLGNVINASATVGANPPTQSYKYDPLYRLKEVDAGASSLLQSYNYGMTGDRTSRTSAGQPAQNYAYTPGTHRLAAVAGVTRVYDADGNTTSDGVHGYAFDNRNRLTSASGGNAPATYQFNGRGERVQKNTSPDFAYDEAGRLIAEYAIYQPPTPGPICEPGSDTCHPVDPGPGTQAMVAPGTDYIYLDNLPIAVVRWGRGGPICYTCQPSYAATVYYVQTDQLGTPRQVLKPGVTPASDTLVWKWDYFANNSAFGENAPSVQTLTFNLRYPGQYYDQETGLNYNSARDYEPGTGRYIESDPVGLEGGLSTYSYANGDPLDAVDPSGLSHFFPGCNSGGCHAPAPAPGPWSPNPGGSAPSRPNLGGAFMDATLTLYRLCNPHRGCPPCKLLDGTEVQPGQISYRYDRLPATTIQHGIAGDHLNLYKANQNPNNCKCFWQPQDTVSPPPQPGWIPIQPFLNAD